MTQKLCEEIEIKDHAGKVRQQRVEYEWRPQFCERCQKVGHVCSNEVEIPVKKWIVKPVIEDTMAEASKIQETEQQIQERREGPIMERIEQAPVTPSDNSKWIEVTRKSKSIGKKARSDPHGKNIFSQNDVQTFDVWNGSKVPPWEVP